LGHSFKAAEHGYGDGRVIHYECKEWPPASKQNHSEEKPEVDHKAQGTP